MFFESSILLKENNIKRKLGRKKLKKIILKQRALKTLKNLNQKKNLSKKYKIISIIITLIIFFFFCIFLFILFKNKKVK